jgi:FG-GAP-like repeat
MFLIKQIKGIALIVSMFFCLSFAITLTANAQAFSEGFEVVSPLPTGWSASNQSTTIGTTGWFQGSTVWPAQTGTALQYIGANFNNTTGSDDISNWLLTPNRTFSNGDVIKFWTRTATTSNFPDRLQVRLSLAGTSTNTGAGPTGLGDFTTLLLDINPTLAVGGYPNAWTEQTITLSGLAAPTSGRIAFRYFVTFAGPLGDNSNIIGIDTFSYAPGVVAPTSFPRSDFDGDGRTDLSTFRPSMGNWYLNRSTAGFSAVPFGISGDIPVPGDYDGDNRADVAVFRPTATAGVADFFVLRSMSNTVSFTEWGLPADLPVVADYDGDNRDDVAIYRPSTNDFYVLRSTTGTLRYYKWGSPGDIPTPGDFDGDGRAEFAVFRPSQGIWYYRNSTGDAFVAVNWGVAGDIPVFANYDTDTKDDIAVYRPSTGFWYINRSLAGAQQVQWGQAGDIPVPGDYDGDGRYDQAVFRAGAWWLNRSTAGSFNSTPRYYLP